MGVSPSMETNGWRGLRWLAESDRAVDGRSPGHSGGFVWMVEDLSDHARVGDESEDLHLAPAWVRVVKGSASSMRKLSSARCSST